MEIRVFCIRFSKRLAKANKKKEIDLLCRLKQLNEHLDQNQRDINLDSNYKKLLNIKQKGTSSPIR